MDDRSLINELEERLKELKQRYEDNLWNKECEALEEYKTLIRLQTILLKRLYPDGGYYFNAIHTWYKWRTTRYSKVKEDIIEPAYVGNDRGSYDYYQAVYEATELYMTGKYENVEVKQIDPDDGSICGTPFWICGEEGPRVIELDLRDKSSS